MSKRIAIECSHAASLAVKLANVDVVAAYPITPQTHIIERLSEHVADGELDADYIHVESEHSAMSVCIGASAVGGRCFTSTSGQGLALMHEMLFIAAGNRLPIVMAVANRCLSPNISIWGDHSDMMASRDCGWIQLYTENAQEIFDLTLQAFKIAEDHRVLLPVAVNSDGFYATHLVESMIALDQDEVDKFLPRHRAAPYTLHPDHPSTWGALAPPDIQTELKKQHDEALRNSKTLIKEVHEEFGSLFGRHYDAVEPYRMDDAEAAIVMMGSFCGTARVAVDQLREEGKRVGLLKLRLFRPFPKDELLHVLKSVKAVAVVDRALSPGGVGSPLFLDIKSSLYGASNRPLVIGGVAGLGGRDIPVRDFIRVAKQALSATETGVIEKEAELLQVRE